MALFFAQRLGARMAALKCLKVAFLLAFQIVAPLRSMANTMGKPMPALNGILETALYVDDLDRARRFYENILALPCLFEDARLCAYDVAGRSVLLLFRRGASLETTWMRSGTIPPHDGSGPLHIAFAIEAHRLTEWEQHLRNHGVEIVGRTSWPRGGQSIYFRDPDGHLLELATPGLWKIY